MKFVITLVLLINAFVLQAQPIEMADQMREDGKIYVVVAVLLAILIGLIVYLITIDKKLSRMEKEIKKS